MGPFKVAQRSFEQRYHQKTVTKINKVCKGHCENYFVQVRLGKIKVPLKDHKCPKCHCNPSRNRRVNFPGTTLSSFGNQSFHLLLKSPLVFFCRAAGERTAEARE